MCKELRGCNERNRSHRTAPRLRYLQPSCSLHTALRPGCATDSPAALYTRYCAQVALFTAQLLFARRTAPRLHHSQPHRCVFWLGDVSNNTPKFFYAKLPNLAAATYSFLGCRFACRCKRGHIRCAGAVAYSASSGTSDTSISAASPRPRLLSVPHCKHWCRPTGMQRSWRFSAACRSRSSAARST